jgi:hypothetical protein
MSDAVGVSGNCSIASSRKGNGWPMRLSSARADLAFSATKCLSRQAASRVAAGRQLSHGVSPRATGNSQSAPGMGVGLRQSHAFGAQHVAQGDQRQADQGVGVIAAQVGEQ